MKNLLIYTGGKKRFDEETETLVKIQIDNILDLRLKKEDTLLVTDFSYKYRGVRSLVVKDGLYYDFDYTSNKIPVICYLIDKGLLEKDELYWYHDFDVYQLEPIDSEVLSLKTSDFGIVPYGYKSQWNLGSIFFKTSAHDIFKLIHQNILFKRKSNNRCDEKALQRLLYGSRIKKERYKELNVTYNFTKRCIATNYRSAIKPLIAVHFHPYDKDLMMSVSAVDLFMHGKNRLKIPLLNPRLIKIFARHGII